MNYDDFHKLRDQETGKLYGLMQFDEQLFPIRRYEIDPEKNAMRIVCKSPDQLSLDQVNRLSRSYPNQG